MVNPYRRWTQEELEVMQASLKLNLQFLNQMKESMASDEKLSESPFLKVLLGAGFREGVLQHYAEQEKRTNDLLEKVRDLYHHDTDWLGDGSPKWCLGCKNRHEPHCSNCMGCLPDKLPE